MSVEHHLDAKFCQVEEALLLVLMRSNVQGLQNSCRRPKTQLRSIRLRQAMEWWRGPVKLSAIATALEVKALRPSPDSSP